MNTTQDKYITLSTVRDLGFTESLIKKLLPEPILKQNPRYKSAPPMKLWEESLVKSAMENELFKASLAKREKRKASAEKALTTRKVNEKNSIESLCEHVHIKRIPLAELRTLSLEAKQKWYDYNQSYYGEERYAYGDEETINRWMTNYVRHNLCDYDDYLKHLKGKISQEELYNLLKNAVMQKIYEVYPELKRTI